MSDLMDLIFDGEGYLGVSNDFWLNTISELFVGVLIVGSVSLLLARYSKMTEDRMRRYERSSKALKLHAHYASALMAWSSSVDTLGNAVAHILKKRDQPFDRVLDAQMASVRAAIQQIEEECRNIREWFEDHYNVYPVEKHKAIHDFQVGADAFRNALGTYVLVFERILSADRNLIKLGGMFVETNTLLSGFETFVAAVRRYPELHTAAFADFLLDTRPMRNSTMAILRVEERHAAFSATISSFANFVTGNYRKSIAAAGLAQKEPAEA